MKINRIIAATLIAATVALGAAACGSSGSPSVSTVSNHKEQVAQGQDAYNLTNNQPVPVYQFSQARQTLINVENIQANGENTTSFGISNNGNLVWECASIGMPVAAATQLTNPSQILPDPNNQYQNNGDPGSLTIEQMDPTGVYTGQSTGTNTLCVDPKGQQFIQYWEGYVDAVSGPAVWDSTTHMVKLLGKPDQLQATPTTPAVPTPTPSASK